MNRLKQLRNSRGITQDELGRMLGVQKAAICKYENGRVNMPNSVIMRLVEIFQVSADYLLCRTEEPDAAASAADREGKFISALRTLIDSAEASFRKNEGKA